MNLGLEDPNVDEYFKNPDFRQIATFFLGWVFLYSLQLIISSKTIRIGLRRLRLFLANRKLRPVPDLEDPTRTAIDPFSRLARQNSLENEHHTLVLMLAICFASSSMAYFASLLRFPSLHAETGCAFVVAWGNMAAQASRLFGLLILGEELYKLGVRRQELNAFRFMLMVSLGLIFAENTITVAVTKLVQQLHISWCYKRHYLPLGLTSSLFLLLLDAYVFSRTAMLITPTLLKYGHQLKMIVDFRIRRVLSLMLLEALTIPSSSIQTNVIVDFVPFSIGAVIVLATFSSTTKHELERTTSYLPETQGPPTPVTRVHSATPTISIRQLPLPTMFAHSNSVIDYPTSNRSSRDSNHNLLTFNRYTSQPFVPLPQDSVSAEIQLVLSLPEIRSPPELLSKPESPRARYILEDQAKYVEQLEREKSLPAGPPWKRFERLVSAGDHEPLSGLSEASGILGSDIIRASSGSFAPENISRRKHRLTVKTSRSIYSPTSGDSTFSSSYATHRSSPASPGTSHSLYPSGDSSRHPNDRNGSHQTRPLRTKRRMTFGDRRNTFGLARSAPAGLISPPPIPQGPIIPRHRNLPAPSGPRPLVTESPRSPPPND